MVRINGTDIKSTYGAFLIDKSYEQLLVYPALKNVISNNWFESDGLEVDLEDSTLERRSFSVTYGVSGTGRWSDFQSFLKTAWTHSIEITDLGLTFDLRFVGITGFEADVDGSLAKIKVSYCDDTLSNYLTNQSSPQRTDYPDGGCTLKGVNVGLYGIRVLNALSDLRKQATPKTALVRAINTRYGAISDVGGTIALGSKGIVVKGVWRASTARDFADSYKTFIKLLNSGSLIEMGYDGSSHVVIYDRLSFSEVSVGADGSVWALFSLNLTSVGKTSVDYWYDFDQMILGVTYDVLSEVKYSVGSDGYLYEKT